RLQFRPVYRARGERVLDHALGFRHRCSRLIYRKNAAKPGTSKGLDAPTKTRTNPIETPCRSTLECAMRYAGTTRIGLSTPTPEISLRPKPCEASRLTPTGRM